MHELIKELFPICRSITGNGVRKSLSIIKKYLPELKLYEIPSGSECFDWTVPDEWNIFDAYVESESGERVIDFKENNLHVLNYSMAVDKTVPFEELNDHLYSLPDQPDAVPYMTSYYDRRWGFCISQNKRQTLTKGNYKVFIDSSLKPGSLTYADLLIPGESSQEILISTYICHPSMANNELSGPALATYLAKWLMEKKRRFTYRIVFVPETIGAICYLGQNLHIMKEKVVAGFQLTCVGDDRTYSFLPSRNGNSLSDRVARHELKWAVENFHSYSFLDRGSDERQYCSPGVDLPVISIMRSKYGQFPEYHTSLDDLTLVTVSGLQGSFERHVNCINILEQNYFYRSTTLGEPQLSKRGLRSTLGAGKGLPLDSKHLSNFLAYCDGSLDLLGIADKIAVYSLDLIPLAKRLLEEGLIKKVNNNE
ncbi:MAG: DUF4910 domain-containing protein [Bacteriovoracaceae bacterium]|nr:DUF4910 domain-containing protein [Bacteriovoracaceae bacterium]